MDLQGLRASLDAAAPPPGLGRALEALWYEAKGEWDRAHRLAQSEDTVAGAWVHAYLHRVEGDEGNAGYWYRRAGVSVFPGSQEEELQALYDAL